MLLRVKERLRDLWPGVLAVSRRGIEFTQPSLFLFWLFRTSKSFFQIFRKESNQVHRYHHRDASGLLPQKAPRADAFVRVYEAWNRGAGQFSISADRIRKHGLGGMRRGHWSSLTTAFLCGLFRGHFIFHDVATRDAALVILQILALLSPFPLLKFKAHISGQQRTGGFLKKINIGRNFCHQKW